MEYNFPWGNNLMKTKLEELRNKYMNTALSDVRSMNMRLFLLPPKSVFPIKKKNGLS